MFHKLVISLLPIFGLILLLDYSVLTVRADEFTFFVDVQDNKGRILEIEDGANMIIQTLSFMTLQNKKMRQKKSAAFLRGAIFDGAIFFQTNLNVSFESCSFRNADLRGCQGKNCVFNDCDLTDAMIATYGYETNLGQITTDGIYQTKNYKERNLVYLTAKIDNSKELFDLSNFDLQFSNIQFKDIQKCKFDNALVKNTKLNKISKKQIASTSDFKKGTLSGINFIQCDLSDICFANMNLSGCRFIASDLLKADFTDAVITNCDFTNAVNFSIDLIKKTWNYRNNQMKSVILPLETYKKKEMDISFSADIYTLNGEKITIADNVNVSGKDISNIDPIYKNGGEDINVYLRNVNFSNANLSDATLNAVCENCSFRGTDLRGFNIGNYYFKNCDFADAKISQLGKITYLYKIESDQFRRTDSYKRRQLAYLEVIVEGDNNSHDFSDFDLRYSKLKFTDKDSDFTYLNGNNYFAKHKLDRAIIEGAYLTQISAKQLYSTSDYVNGRVHEITFVNCNFANANFSKIDMSGCKFITYDEKFPMNLLKANFNDSVISNCDFTKAKNLTVDQIKSTWNYKSNRMEGIKLPAEIQEALDAEKQKIE